MKLIDVDCRLKSDENERFSAKQSGYSLGTLLTNDQIWNWLILIADWKVMKMSDFWRKSKAIALAVCSEMTKFEIDWFLLQIEKWWKWAIFGQEVRVKPWYFAQKGPNLKLIYYDCRLKSDENERFLAKK